MKEKPIFISYRKVNIGGKRQPPFHVRWLSHKLEEKFGAVFLDERTIPPGAEWERYINDTLAASRAVLVIVDKGWVGARNHGAMRRIDNPADRLRREVELSLASSAIVIPVLVNIDELPDLPESLARIKDKQQLFLRTADIPDNVDQFFKRLEGALRQAPTTATPWAVFGEILKNLPGVPRWPQPPPPPPVQDPTRQQTEVSDPISVGSEEPRPIIDPGPVAPPFQGEGVAGSHPVIHSPPVTPRPLRTHPLLGELMILFDESARYYWERDRLISAHLTRANNAIEDLNRRTHSITGFYAIALGGLADRARSSFLRQLMDDQYSGDADVLWPGCRIELRYGPMLRIRASHANSVDVRFRTCNGSKELYTLLARFAEELPNNSDTKAQPTLEVHAPLPLLAHGLIIVLLPTSTDHDEHGGIRDVTTNSEHAFSQMLWCVKASQVSTGPCIPDELRPWNRHCNDILIVDSTAGQEELVAGYGNAIDHWFPDHIPRLHLLHGATNGRSGQMTADVECLGATYLARYLERVSTVAGRQQEAGLTLLALAESVARWLREYRTKCRQMLPRWWPADSWGRWTRLAAGKDFAQHAKLHRKLCEQLSAR